jgi:hypothetical protein
VLLLLPLLLLLLLRPPTPLLHWTMTLKSPCCV